MPKLLALLVTRLPSPLQQKRFSASSPTVIPSTGIMRSSTSSSATSSCFCLPFLPFLAYLRTRVRAVRSRHCPKAPSAVPSATAPQLRRGGPSAGGGGRGARALGHGHHGGPGQNRGLELQSHGFGPGLAFGLSSLGAPTLRGGRSEEATDETAMRGGIAHEKRGEDADIISHIHYMP